jgi:hypothetical protein
MDRVQHAVDVFDDVIVPEADDAIALSFQPARSLNVSCLFDTRAMLGAVDFDQNAHSHAGEVRDIGTDGNLPAEVTTVGIEPA